MRDLKSARAIVAALGGNASVAELTGKRTQHITNWKTKGRLPARTYLILSAALAEHGYQASPKLWGITPVAE